MSGVGLIAILITAFALAIGLVQVLGRLIESGDRDDRAGERPERLPGAGTVAGALLQRARPRRLS